MSPPSTSGTPRGELTGHVLAGRYELERPLAVGGMAQVWVARDRVLARPVAVKVLHGHLIDDRSFVARFRAEALSAARLSHPSIVSVYDTCSEPGIEAIVMELVKGRTLRDLLDERGRLGSAETCRIASRIADALGVAHRAGIVHRDVKPANVLLSDDGRVVVTDFGIAKASEGADLTTDRQMLGTAKYLAPEQVEGDPVDGRTDVYALGVVLYEMVCGEVPFHASSEASTALARLHRDPTPPRQVRADVPRPLEEVILRALARRPPDRFADASSLSQALNRAVRATPDRTADDPDTGADDPTEAVPRAPGKPRFTATPVSTLAPPRPIAAAASPVASEPPAPPHGEPERPADPRPHRPRALLVLGGLVVVGLVVAGLLAANLIGGDDSEPLTVQPATFDPFGTGAPGENDDRLALAFDGDPATAWPTEAYSDPDVGAAKGGVGLLLALDRRRPVDRLAVRSPTTGWDARVYVLDAPPDGGVDSWGDPAATASGIDGDHTFDLGGAQGDVVILWITRTGDEGIVEVAEAVASG